MYLKNNVKIKKGYHNTALYDFNSNKVYLVANSAGEALSYGKIELLDKKLLNKMISLQLLVTDRLQREADPLVFEYGLFSDSNSFEKCKLAYLEITDKCNYHCIHCYANIQQSASQFMDHERARKYIYQIAKMGDCDIRITGGEPFLNPYLIEIIDVVCNDIVPVTRHSIVTNGSFDINKAVHILKSGFELQISIYGMSKEKFAFFTNTSQQLYEKVMDNLDILSKTEYRKQVLLLFSVNSLSYDDIEVFKAYAEEKGFRYMLNRPASVGRAVENWELLELPQDKYVSFSNTQRHANTLFCYHLCQLHWTSIMPNGDVSPCGFLRDKENVIGNLEEQSFEELWTSNSYNDFRKLNAMNVSKCRECEFCYLCTAGCCGETKAYLGDLLSSYIWCKAKPYSDGKYLDVEPSELYEVIKNAAGLFDYERMGND